MPELDDALDASPAETEPSKPKKKDKVRSVWISFIGRIVAQIIGAIASVVLGIFILQRYQDSPAAPPPTRRSRRRRRARMANRPCRAAARQLLRDPADAYFAQGIPEVLISDLAQIKGWRVIPDLDGSVRTAASRLRRLARTECRPHPRV